MMNPIAAKQHAQPLPLATWARMETEKSPQRPDPLWLLPLLGASLTAVFPPLNLWAAGWGMMAVGFWLLTRECWNPWRWFWSGWGWGIAFYGLQFAWTTDILFHDETLAWWRLIVLFGGLCLVMGIFQALVWGLLGFLRWRYGSWVALWAAPLVFGTLDICYQYVPFGGVGWGSLAAPQTHTLSGNLAGWFGGAGLVGLVTGVNAAWGGWAAYWTEARFSKWQKISITLGLCLLTLLAAWPRGRPVPLVSKKLNVTDSVKKLAVVLTSGAKQQTWPNWSDWLSASITAIKPITAENTISARLAIWPEGALFYPPEQGKQLALLAEEAAAYRLDVLLGAPGLLPQTTTLLKQARINPQRYNSAFLIQSRPFEVMRYHKRQLAPFGEYVPVGWKWLLPHRLTQGHHTLIRGQLPAVLQGRGYRLGVAICFEGLSSAHLRQATLQGAQLLIVLANHSWLSKAASHQHAQLSALKSLETGIPVLIVAQNGWSAQLQNGLVAAHIPPIQPQTATADTSQTKTISLQALATTVPLDVAPAPWVKWGNQLLIFAAICWSALGAALIHLFYRR